MSSRLRAWSTLAAGLCLACGVFLAGLHPIAPGSVLAAFVALIALIVWQPRIWLWLVPACLPILNFAPWTGGLIVEEFDLLVLGVAAGLHARRVLSGRIAQPEERRWPAAVRGPSLFFYTALLFGLFSAASMLRGVVAAGGLSLANAWFQGYADPLNAWRVFKSVIWAGLLWWPLRREIAADRDSAVRRFVAGVLTGLLLVVLAVVWERAAYPGIWEFSGHYRTTALFWEMHVGGGAIDAYLALAVPFVAWALWSQKSPWLWSAAAALAVLTTYACLTTFSRGVYFAVAAPLVALGVTLAWRRIGHKRRQAVLNGLMTAGALIVAATALASAFEIGGVEVAGLVLLGILVLATAFGRWIRPVGWRTAASLALALALLLEVFAVFGLGTFLRERIAATDGDFVSRRQHWSDGLGLMHTPSDWLLGIGTGRLPAGYATHVPGVELPGDVSYLPGTARNGSVLLLGPRTRDDDDRLLMLNQRIDLRGGRGHRVDLDVRVTAPTELYLRVCEAHLLYARVCQTRLVGLHSDASNWHHLSVPLVGHTLTRGAPAWPRRAVFSMAVVNAGGGMEIDNVQLRTSDGAQLLSNGDFSNGMAHWLPTAAGYFLPWHIDNLYLEVLVERGAPALLTFVLCVAIALRRLLRESARAIPFAPFLAASLCGALCAGLVDSIMDVPRVAFLLFFVVMAGAELGSALNVPASRAGPGA